MINCFIITCVFYSPCSDLYHNEPYKALQDWTDHLDRMAELNKIFPGDHPSYYEPKRPLPLPDRRAKSLPPVKTGYNYSGNIQLLRAYWVILKWRTFSPFGGRTGFSDKTPVHTVQNDFMLN